MNWTLAANSLVLAAGSALLATLAGAAVALLALSLPRRAGLLVMACAGVGLALPPFLVTNCWLDLLGNTGRWRGWLPFSIYSMGGAVLVLSSLLWPLAAFLAWGAWRGLDTAHFEIEPAATGNHLVRAVLWPVAQPALGAALLLAFTLGLNNVSVPFLLQVKVLPAEAWLQFSTLFDPLAAFALCWPLILAPLVLWLVWPRGLAWPREGQPPDARAVRQRVGPRWFWGNAAVATVVLLVAVGLPVTELLASERTWMETGSALAAAHRALGMTLATAALTALLVALAGVSLSSCRAEGVAWLLFLLPGMILGIGLIWLLNRPGLTWLYQSLAVIPVALALRYGAIGWSAARQAVAGVDPELTDAARLEGASRWQLWRRVLWPQVSGRVVAGAYVVYLLCLWEVEVLLLVQPPGAETLALRVFNLLHYGHNSQVNALCLLLLLLAALPLLIWGVWRVLQRPGGLRGSPAFTLVLLMPMLALAGCGKRGGEVLSESQFFSRVEMVGTRGSGPGQFQKPRSLAIDREDNLYVADMTGRIQKFSPTGQFLLSWQMPQTDLGRPKGMCLDSAGNVIVIEPHYSRVNHFDAQGKLLSQWGAHGTNDGQLAFPRAVALNSRGECFVSEYGVLERVQRFAAAGGSWVASLGHFGSGPGEFNRAEGLCVDAQDHLYVADSCNHRIQVFDPAGKLLRTYGHAGAAKGELSYPYDIQVDAAGCQFVCEFGNSRLQVFDRQDRPIEVIGGPGGGPGEFSNPWSIALDSKGNLYVADAANHRVQKLIRKQPVRVGQGLNHAASVAAPQAREGRGS
jgi:ABC-type Fe3+ transport system permease subunit/DNA-binding beta-propeller fold protein YncE